MSFNYIYSFQGIRTFDKHNEVKVFNNYTHLPVTFDESGSGRVAATRFISPFSRMLGESFLIKEWKHARLYRR